MQIANIIDPIKYHLSRINPDIPSWRIKLTNNSSHGTKIHAYNKLEYKGRMIDFYVLYVVNRVTFDISFSRIIFSQNQEYNHHIGNQKTRERLERELIKKLNIERPHEAVDAQKELEKAIRIIIAVSNSYE